MAEYTEQELNDLKKYVKGLLNDANIPEVCITFTKKDGTERNLRCTLNEHRIQSDKQPKDKTASVSSDEAIRDIDVEKRD